MMFRDATTLQLQRIAIVGNPNTGKSTLFNALTGLRQKVANYPGVTVEKKEGCIHLPSGRESTLVDLPGLYSLNAASPDEALAANVLLGTHNPKDMPEIVLCAVDATNLERNLYLVVQLMEKNIPVVVALTMMDVAERSGLIIDTEKFSAALGAPVVPVVAHKGTGIEELKATIERQYAASPPREHHHHQSETALHSEDMALMVEKRYAKIRAIFKAVVTRKARPSRRHSDAIDRILTHRFWGFIILLAAMGIMFQLVFTLSDIFSDGINSVFRQIAGFTIGMMNPGDLRDLLVHGIIEGTGSVVVFIPQIAFLFLFLGILEESGYLSRAAFIMDRVMRKSGLHGKAFIPLLSSFGCTVPSIMATRTLGHERDRIATMMVAPLLSCSARLPVYALLIAALIPQRNVLGFLSLPGLTLAAIYLIGVLAAFIVAWILKKILSRNVSTPFIMELPAYRLPSLKSVALQVWERTSAFLQKAGTVILGASIVLWFLLTYPKSDAVSAGERLEQSFAGKAGHMIEPVIRPLGFNWKIGIGLISSLLQREVFVSTMGTMYGINDHNSGSSVATIRQKMESDVDPITGRPTFTALTALCLMIYYMIALQCFSTMVVTRRETNGWKWPIIQLSYLSILAYVLTFAVHRIGSIFIS